MYDKALRKQIASQTSLPLTTRTAFWDKLNDELFNAFLRDSSSQLPTCYHCYSTGHYASNCPFKNTASHTALTTPSYNFQNNLRSPQQHRLVTSQYSATAQQNKHAPHPLVPHKNPIVSVFVSTTPASAKNRPAHFDTSVKLVKNQDTPLTNASPTLAPLFVHEPITCPDKHTTSVNIVVPVNITKNIETFSTHKNKNIENVQKQKHNNSSTSVNSVNNVVNSSMFNNKFCPLPTEATTPVNILNFENCLSSHPDKHLTTYLVNGLRNGFDIGFNAPHSVTMPNNLLSATEHTTSVHPSHHQGNRKRSYIWTILYITHS